LDNKGRSLEREQWGSKFGFIMAAAGSAVGLGNIWRFPYLAGEYGGAAFLIIYILAVILLGFTVMLCEFAIGRAARLNAVGSFRKLTPGTPWWLVGAMGVLAPFLILAFYGVVAGWTGAYIWMTINGTLSGVPTEEYANIFINFITDPVQPIIWQAIYMALTIGIVVAGIKGGIEKASKVLMPSVIIILLLLIIRGVTLEGSWEGLQFYLNPDFSEVTGKTLLVALGQAFFSLSLGMGIMITYGSYIGQRDNMPSSAITVIGFDTLVAVLAGLAIFPALFAVGMSPDEGAGLVFIILPAVFDAIPFGKFFGAIFFVLLSIAALTSTISLLEVVVAFVKDHFRIQRTAATIITGTLIFLVGVTASLSMGPWDYIQIPFPGHGSLNLFDFYDNLTALVFLPLGGMLVCLYAIWAWKPHNLFKEITNNGELSFTWLPLFKILAGIIAPIIIFLVLLNGFGILG
jgi:NSS family neurotransmitter:Na+ symporter